MKAKYRGASSNRAIYCWKEKKPCSRWVQKYFKDCLCNVRDDLSFGFGIISLIAWAVAEVPQIITNFRTKSSHGVSLLFLIGWFLGDIFNLAGCLLEPATLPTQFYTALFYTISTIVLVLQSVYYDYFYSWWKCRHDKVHSEADQEVKKPLNPKPTDQATIPIPSSPVRAPTRRYYMSARSLAGSDTPPFRSYLRSGPRSGPSAVGLDDHSSSDDEETNPIPIPAKRGTTGTSLPRQIPRPAARGAMVAVSVNLPSGGNALSEAYRGFTGRRMLLSEHASEHSAVGQWLGWLMAAIYMGGRIPQIVWNIKRGSVEGLNPLMFMFALIANVAYVASILARHTEFEEIKANMPWLLDAVVCVVLDLFIIMQYVYYKHMRKRNTREEDQDFYYEEAPKPIVS
ncbi:uncharacterized protein LOC110686220 isoform X2 [Chenopodium quinoa]|uniref:uncharacterized protein LOC110686220 isoform X2 n=1 Tax=Chenopodium quinoa TaxID=63459 RepID=UPI000B77C14D|nr:uncharacterized protein LOC110686220 isoform X2 [Chenopodium quinoa]